MGWGGAVRLGGGSGLAWCGVSCGGRQRRQLASRPPTPVDRGAAAAEKSEQAAFSNVRGTPQQLSYQSALLSVLSGRSWCISS